MVFLRRGPHATYARILDGEHVWLAVRGAEALFLRRAGADDVDLDTETTHDAEGSLLAVRYAVAAAHADDPAEEIRLDLHARTRRSDTPVVWRAAEPRGPALVAPLTEDHRWQWRALPHRGRVTLVRTPAAAGVPVLAMRRTDAGVELRLPGDQVGAAEHAEVAHDGVVLDRPPLVVDGADCLLVLTGAPGVPEGTVANVSVGGLPVVRRANEVARPHLAVALPALPDPEVELRWLPCLPDGGTLAIQRVDQPGDRAGEQP